MDVGALADQTLLIINAIIGDKLGIFVDYESICTKYTIWRESNDTSQISDELRYILFDYLIPKNYIVSGTKNPSQPQNTQYKITPDGYAYLNKVQTMKHSSNIGFCAMWFDKGMDLVWEDAIKPAITECGYQALRIDKVHHNNDINAEIIINLNKSKFIIADFTGGRGGVYFEAGYAMGKNIPVIYTCRNDWFTKKRKPHFDIDHYPFIKWDESDLEKFKKMLSDRITNTISFINER